MNTSRNPRGIIRMLMPVFQIAGAFLLFQLFDFVPDEPFFNLLSYSLFLLILSPISNLILLIVCIRAFRVAREVGEVKARRRALAGAIINGIWIIPSTIAVMFLLPYYYYLLPAG